MKLKKVCVMGMAAVMLMFGHCSTVVEAATGCGHIWTAEEYGGRRYTGEKVEHTENDGTECTIYFYREYYNIVCRACGEHVGERPGGLVEVHVEK